MRLVMLVWLFLGGIAVGQERSLRPEAQLRPASVESMLEGMVSNGEFVAKKDADGKGITVRDGKYLIWRREGGYERKMLRYKDNIYLYKDTAGTKGIITYEKDGRRDAFANEKEGWEGGGYTPYDQPESTSYRRGKLYSMHNRFSDLHSKFSPLNSEFSELNSKFSKLNSKFSRMNSRTYQLK